MQFAQSKTTALCVRYKSNFSAKHHNLSSEMDAQLCIFEGSHNHDPEHKVNHISNKQYQSQNSNPGSCHGCSGPYLIEDSKNSVCKRCIPSVDNCVPARCSSRKPPAKQQQLNFLYNDISHRNQSNNHNDQFNNCLFLQVNQSTFRTVRSSKI